MELIDWGSVVSTFVWGIAVLVAGWVLLILLSAAWSRDWRRFEPIGPRHDYAHYPKSPAKLKPRLAEDLYPHDQADQPQEPLE